MKQTPSHPLDASSGEAASPMRRVAPPLEPSSRPGSAPAYSNIYVEREVLDHPRAQRLIARFPRAQVVPIERHAEIFNPRGQNFRLQKRKPALILAHKQAPLLHETPEGYGIGERSNFYFSHMLNCLYDCRYCFLQGMFSSAHHLLFVNFEDFVTAIADQMRTLQQPSWFFSGYDCDSLALESVTGFAEFFVPRIAQIPGAHLELRTKSAQVKQLLQLEAQKNTVVAFSLSPKAVVEAAEAGTARLDRRIAAARTLADAGWRIGLRFDPLVYHEGWEANYRDCVARVFAELSPDALHSITIGPMRFPKAMYQRIVKLHPQASIFSGPASARASMVSLPPELEAEMVSKMRGWIAEYAPKVPQFACTPPDFAAQPGS